MKIISKVNELREAVQAFRQAGKSVGLVPTMGALHEGHKSLVDRARKENDAVVVSCFLNPTQFNNKEDLRTYPRTAERDAAMLESCGVDVAFMPTVEEIYPEPDTRVFDLGPVQQVMEGAMRPGHFNGVCQIVSKLFMYVEPDRAYFGEKDYQQIAVIRRMVDDLGFKLKMVPCPVVRQSDGLALSSRNALLTEEERKTAANIYRIMNESRIIVREGLAYGSGGMSVQQTHDYVVDAINAIDGLEVQYFSIVDGDTLADVTSWDEAQSIVGCITVFCGTKPIRLIDHIRYK